MIESLNVGRKVRDKNGTKWIIKYIDNYSVLIYNNDTNIQLTIRRDELENEYFIY